MNDADWLVFRRLDMYQIENECLKEIDAELDGKKESISPLLILFNGVLILFLMLFLSSFISNPMILYEFFEAPILKPIMLGSPGLYGLYISWSQKKKMKSNVRRLETKYGNTDNKNINIS